MDSVGPVSLYQIRIRDWIWPVRSDIKICIISANAYFRAVLGIRNILVRIRIPDLWLTDPDPTPFFSDFKDAKQKISHIFFLQLTRRHIIFSLCVKIYFVSIITVRPTPLWEKGRIRIRTRLTDPDPGGLKTCDPQDPDPQHCVNEVQFVVDTVGTHSL